MPAAITLNLAIFIRIWQLPQTISFQITRIRWGWSKESEIRNQKSAIRLQLLLFTVFNNRAIAIWTFQYFVAFHQTINYNRLYCQFSQISCSSAIQSK